MLAWETGRSLMKALRSAARLGFTVSLKYRRWQKQPLERRLVELTLSIELQIDFFSGLSLKFCHFNREREMRLRGSQTTEHEFGLSLT